MFHLKEEENILSKNSYKLIQQIYCLFVEVPLLILIKSFSKRTRASSIGFGAEVKNLDRKKVGEIIRNLEPEDLLKYGLIPEFIGRLPITATLEDLDEVSLVKILTEPKNSLVKQYKELFKFERCKISF